MPDTLQPHVLARLRAEHPDLIINATLSRHALAAKNARILLKRHFPSTRFRVLGRAFAGGTSLTVQWEIFDERDPQNEAVQALLKPFEARRYDATHDCWDGAPEHQDFRVAFGGASYVMDSSHEASPEQKARRQGDTLSEAVSSKPQTPRVRLRI